MSNPGKRAAGRIRSSSCNVVSRTKALIAEAFRRRRGRMGRSKILEVLKREGYIISYEITTNEKQIKNIFVKLKYYDGQPVIREIKRISKPGRRVYSKATSIPKVLNGLGLAILSTSKGVMSDAEATKNNLGGEIICRIF